MSVVRLTVREMTGRSSVRAVASRVCDLPGVETLEANADTAVLIVRGDVTCEQVRSALADAGFNSEDNQGSDSAVGNG